MSFMKSTYRELVRQGFGFTSLNYTAVFSYDAAGRLVREGNRTYRYGYLDKVLFVTDGKRSYRYAYHVDGQLARVDYGEGGSEDFHWDGLALIQRGDEQFMNEPHIGGGNPVASSNGTSYFNDMLGTTVGAKKDGKYSAAALSAFGENLSVDSPTPTQNSNFFTGKPYVEGLGHAFLMRNYRASLGKWLTADPLGYPDGWNALAYGINSPSTGFDKAGGSWSRWDDEDFTSYYFTSYRIYGDGFDTDNMGLTGEIFAVINDVVLTRVEDQIDAQVASLVAAAGGTSGGGSFRKGTSNSYSFSGVCFSLGDGSVQTSSQVTYSWFEMSYNNIRYRYYEWSATIWVNYSDIFKDPLDIGIEIPGGQAYYYYHTWTNIHRSGFGIVVLE
jgi:RHS repeat-associated protein